MQIITPEEATHILGTHAAVIEGTSFIFYDTRQFMAVSVNRAATYVLLMFD